MPDKKLIIIGAGPGGYAAAFYAADMGLEVTLVDAGSAPGGVCLHKGCIPSKALLHIASLIDECRQASEWGISFAEPEIDLGRLRNWSEKIVGDMAAGLVSLCKRRKITLIQGHAKFQGSNTISVAGADPIPYDHCILAVGSHPALPPIFDADSPRIMDSTSALQLNDIPSRLLIVGGGYIGLELGTVYAALGSQVTVIELTDGLLPEVDRDLVRPLFSRLKASFENIYLGSKVVSAKDEGDEVRVCFEDENGSHEECFDRVLVAVGRRPNSEGIGLENTDVELDENAFIKVNDQLQTNDPAIWAIGDVIGGAMLAHKASHEGKAAVDVIMGGKALSATIPAVVFTNPEIAWAGLSETQAKSDGKEITVAKFPWAASGRAQTLARTEGMSKLIIDPQSKKILGIAVVGAGAGELIAEGILAIENGLTATDLAETVHPHPTLSETVMEAAQVFLGKAIHVFKPPRK